MMVACGGWDGGLWVARIWLWQLGWSVVVVYSGFLGFMKACSGGWLWVCENGEWWVVRVAKSNGDSRLMSGWSCKKQMNIYT